MRYLILLLLCGCTSQSPRTTQSVPEPLYHRFHGREYVSSEGAMQVGTKVEVSDGWVEYHLDVPVDSYALNIRKDGWGYVGLPDWENKHWTFTQPQNGDLFLEDIGQYVHNGELWIALYFYETTGTVEYLDAYYSRLVIEGVDDYEPWLYRNKLAFTVGQAQMVNKTFPPGDLWETSAVPMDTEFIFCPQNINTTHATGFSADPIVSSVLRYNEGILVPQWDTPVIIEDGTPLVAFDIPHRTLMLAWSEKLVAYYSIDGIGSIWRFNGELYQVAVGGYEPLGDIVVNDQNFRKYFLYEDVEGYHLLTGTGTNLVWTEELLPDGYSHDRAEMAWTHIGSPPLPSMLTIFYSDGGGLYRTVRNDGWNETFMTNVVEWDLWVNGWIAQDSRIVYTDAQGSLWYTSSNYWDFSKWTAPILVDYDASDPQIVLIGTDERFIENIKAITYLKDGNLMVAQLQ